MVRFEVPRTDCDLVGILEERTCDSLYFLGPGGAPEQGLSIWPNLSDNLLDLCKGQPNLKLRYPCQCHQRLLMHAT